MGVIKVFISYAREDKKIAEALAEALSKYDEISVWMDKKSLQAGEEWAESIADALSNCDCVLALHSQYSLNRSFISKGEWIHAQDMKKTVYPIIIDPSAKPHKYLEQVHALVLQSFSSITEMTNALVSAIKSGKPPVKPINTLEEAELAYYPNFYNDYSASKARLFKKANEICYIGAIGFTFVPPDETAIHQRLVNGAKLRIILADRSLINYRIVATRSAYLHEGTEKRIQDLKGEAEAVIERLKILGNDVRENAIEVRLLEFVPTAPMLFVNPKENDGILNFSVYSYGRSINNMVARLSTILTKHDYPDVFEHLYQNFQNAWNDAKPYEL